MEIIIMYDKDSKKQMKYFVNSDDASKFIKKFEKKSIPEEEKKEKKKNSRYNNFVKYIFATNKNIEGNKISFAANEWNKLSEEEKNKYL